MRDSEIAILHQISSEYIVVILFLIAGLAVLRGCGTPRAGSATILLLLFNHHKHNAQPLCTLPSYHFSVTLAPISLSFNFDISQFLLHNHYTMQGYQIAIGMYFGFNSDERQENDKKKKSEMEMNTYREWCTLESCVYLQRRRMRECAPQLKANPRKWYELGLPYNNVATHTHISTIR